MTEARDKNISDNRHYPQLPVLSAGAVIFREESVLLVKRAHEPAKGLWSIPGGVIQVGEYVRDGLIREVLEETGVRIELGELVQIVERIVNDDNGKIAFHYVILDYLGEYRDGKEKAATDAEEALFVSMNEFKSYELTFGLAEVIEKAWLMRTQELNNQT